MPKTLSLVWAILLACPCFASPCFACEIDTIPGPPILSSSLSSSSLDHLSSSSLSSSSLDHLNSQYTSLDKNISQQTASVLASMQSKEASLRARVAKKDSTRAGLLFDSAQATYQQWQKRLQSPMTAANAASLNEYIPRLDSMSNALKFLQGKNISLPAGELEQVQALSGRLQVLQGKLQVASEAQSFVQAREQLLKTQLSSFGLAGKLTGINKQVFYYQQQLAQYKQELKDPDKWAGAVLGAVRQSPAFQNYMQKNGYLARMFPASPNQGTAIGMVGLQKSEDIQKELLAKFGKSALTPPAEGGGSSGPLGGSGGLLGSVGSLGGSSPLLQQVQSAQGALSKLKDKIDAAGGGSSDMTLPDFSPNGQKLKKFLKRLEYGIDVQSQQGTYYLPATTNFALTLGYKLSDKATIGVGSSYNMGWGSGFNDIHLSSQGISLRSFIDIKAKGSIWLTGGWEYNYMQAFSSLSDIRNFDVWQKSALIGVMKKCKIGKQNSYVQLLYDLLAASETPQPSAFKFRVGYTF